MAMYQQLLETVCAMEVLRQENGGLKTHLQDVKKKLRQMSLERGRISVSNMLLSLSEPLWPQCNQARAHSRADFYGQTKNNSAHMVH